MTPVYPPDPPGLKLKLRRARSKLGQLRRTFDRFVATHPCTWRREINDKGTHYLYSLQCPPGPTSVQFLADEAVHHLRSLLDHILTATIEAIGKDATGCQFPILDVEPKTAKAIKAFKGAFENAPKAIRDLIVDVQPYKRWNGLEPHRHPLWLLNRIGNRFKHSTFDLLTYRIMAPSLPGAIGRLSRQRLAKSGEVFAEVPINVDVEKDFEPYLAVDVTFQVTRLGIDGVGINALDEIYNFVRDEIAVKILKGPFPPRL